MVRVINKSTRRSSNSEFRCGSVKMLSTPSFEVEVVINRKHLKVYKIHSDGTRTLLKRAS